VFEFSVITGRVVHDLIHADFPGVAGVIKEAYTGPSSRIVGQFRTATF